MLFAPEVLVFLPQRSEMVSIITKDATIRLHEVVRGRHENSRPRRRRAEALPGVLEGRRHGGEVGPDVECSRERTPLLAVHAQVHRKTIFCPESKSFGVELDSGRVVADGARLARVVRGQNRRDHAATSRA